MNKEIINNNMEEGYVILVHKPDHSANSYLKIMNGKLTTPNEKEFATVFTKDMAEKIVAAHHMEEGKFYYNNLFTIVGIEKTTYGKTNTNGTNGKEI